MKSKQKTRIALAFPLSLAFIERLQQGILDYAREHGRWTFTRVPEMLSPSIDWLRHWPGEAAFVLVTTPEDARIARSLAIPVVNLAGHLKDPGVPTVMVDHAATGRLAAAHLLERNFRRFGFYGTSGKWYSEQRRQGFCETLLQAGRQCDVLEVPPVAGTQRKWADQQEEIEHWLRKLQPPVGILASTDLRAGIVLEACARLALRVPEQVAIIGVDNDPVACEFCQPPLSSVSRNDREVGYQAAALLDRLISGAPAPDQPCLILPDTVVPRSSTETLAIDDPQVARVVEHIREHVQEAFGVERVLGQTALSRRCLEHRFRQSLGRTPYRFINEQRVERAKQLLAQPERRSLSAIAAACGFSELRRFRLVFRRLTGISPAEYRRAAAEDAPPTAQGKSKRPLRPVQVGSQSKGIGSGVQG